MYRKKKKTAAGAVCMASNVGKGGGRLGSSQSSLLRTSNHPQATGCHFLVIVTIVVVALLPVPSTGFSLSSLYR
jgi:magnesium-transporting ATPase (P-type)